MYLLLTSDFLENEVKEGSGESVKSVLSVYQSTRVN